jgi:outer membrane protein, heavy metal efflux system
MNTSACRYGNVVRPALEPPRGGLRRSVTVEATARLLAGLLAMFAIASGCRWNDLGVTGRVVPGIPHDDRSLGSRDSDPGVVKLTDDPCDALPGLDCYPVSMDHPLTLEQVLETVRQNHPSVDAAEAAWLASREEYPQVTSLKDPQIRLMNGPTIFGPASGQMLWRFQIAQPVPWFGKRTLRGEVADQQSHVAQAGWKLTQQALMERAAEAFLAYAQTERMYELARQEQEMDVAKLNRQRNQLIVQVGATSETGPGEVESLELAWLEHEQKGEELEQVRFQARRRLNHLLHREPDEPLPEVSLAGLEDDLPEEHVLVEQAFRKRPELSAARSRIREAEYKLDLAYKEFFPDFYLVGRFDTVADQFWSPDRANIRPLPGIYLYPPVFTESKRAAVRQAEWKIRSERAKLIAEETEIRNEVQETLAQWRYALNRLEKNERMVQLAQQRVEQLESYVSHDPEFEDRLVAARRKLISVRMDQTKAEFDARRRQAQIRLLTGEPY